MKDADRRDPADPLAMNDFNVFTFTSKAYPATSPLIAEQGQLVRIRLGNLGPMDHHPIHLHGYSFHVGSQSDIVVPTPMALTTSM